MLMMTAEITIYVLFFHHVYRNDNGEGLRRLLEPSVIRRRNRTNAITFFAQFCSFVFEFSIGIVIISAVMGGAPFSAVYILKVISFTSMSIIEVVASNSLRQRIFNP